MEALQSRIALGRTTAALLGALLALSPFTRAFAADAEEEESDDGKSSKGKKDKDKDKEEEDDGDKKPSKSSGGGSKSSIVARVSLETSVYTDTDNVFVLTPTLGASLESPTAGWSVNGRYVLDAVSAASVDIVSTATPAWHEIRHAGTLGGQYKPGDFGVNLGGYISREPDYLSLTGAAGFIWDLDQKNVTLTGGYSYGHDIVGYHFTDFSVFSHTVDKHSLVSSMGFLVDRASTFTVVADAQYERGDQSKPYRYIPMFQASVAPTVPNGASVDLVNSLRLPERPAEQLPLARDRYALSAKYAHRFDESTIRWDNRFYGDSWGSLAVTSDFRWLIDLGSRVMIWPHLRFHGQSAVTFWQKAYVAYRGANNSADGWAIPQYRTGDRELGPLVAGTGGGGIKFGLGGKADPMSWSLSLVADGNWTSYLDDIYLLGRASFFSALTLEGEL